MLNEDIVTVGLNVVSAIRVLHVLARSTSKSPIYLPQVEALQTRTRILIGACLSGNSRFRRKKIALHIKAISGMHDSASE